MEELKIWLSLGFEHIIDVSAYDHILFVSLLVISFAFEEWKKLVLVITAFTLGHSFSLAISVLYPLTIPIPLIELLIALTLLITAVFSIFSFYRKISASFNFLFLSVVFFGMIHGLGFSQLLVTLLGKEQSVFLPLLYFNVGLELAQLIIVLAVLLFSLFLSQFKSWSNNSIKLFLACILTLVASKIMLERLLVFF